MARQVATLAVLIAAFLAPGSPHASRAAELDGANAFGEVPLSDVLEVLVANRELLAIDARGGSQTTERLRLEEIVLWKGARGKVGMVLTNQRILAVATQSGAWQATDVHRTESRPEEALLGERVALVVTNERAIGFDGGSANLVETSLGLREEVLAQSVGENVGVLVTNRRALGLSPFVGGFSEIMLGLRERIESVSAGANVATITTDRRLLIYRSPSGSWEEKRLNLK
ncbi:MAG: hypothetical protein HRU01_02370 [Myxococcales bacterium]|nr:hypothetical protein [Myxococcales bacterium]